MLGFIRAREGEFDARVAEFISRDLCTIEHDADIIRVSEAFISKGLRRLPVVQQVRLIGQIMLRAVEEFARDG